MAAVITIIYVLTIHQILDVATSTIFWLIWRAFWAMISWIGMFLSLEDIGNWFVYGLAGVSIIFSDFAIVWRKFLVAIRFVDHFLFNVSVFDGVFVEDLLRLKVAINLW